MTIDMNQFYQVFFEEADELLAEMEKLLLAIDLDAPDNEELHAVFRTAHSIKGGAATFGLNDLTDVTHVLESLLDKIRNGELALTRAHVDAFLSAKDVLKMQVDGHRHAAPVDELAVAAIRAQLESMLPQSAALKGAAVHTPPAAVAPSGSCCYRMTLPTLSEADLDAITAELGLLGTLSIVSTDQGKRVVDLVTEESPADILALCSFVMDPADIGMERRVEAGISDADARAAQEAAQGYGFFEPFVPLTLPQAVAETDDTVSSALPLTETAATDDAGKRAHPDATENRKPGARNETDKSAHHSESSSIRVGIEKVDQLINLVGELVITQAMIEQRTKSLDPTNNEKLLNSVSQLTRNTRDLQEAVMSIRMMPMDYVFSRFPRMVRDLAAKLGKKVDFVTQGAATELDKGLIERIVDPLTHLVRNSIDHGIEMPDVRREKGKAEAGRLSLSAAHQGGNIVIEVTDDGGGLNRQRILAKAREKHLPITDGMSDADVWQLIFAPGFSTAEQVTDVSGRGVGMDVVKRNIAAMGGVVDIRSSEGFGTTISISLPLTLAILDGMSIKVADEIYILPLGYVVESLQPVAADIKDISGQGRVIKVRGEYLPLVPLHALFNLDAAVTDPEKGIVVILESDGRKMAMLIDELVGQQQIVVKNLESNYRKVPGVSGATILGDGGVALIVDVAAMLRSTRRPSEEAVF